MKLVPLTLEGALAVLPLRESRPQQFRTGKPVSEKDQHKWWVHVTSQMSNARWWEFSQPIVSGYAGIEHIDWIARTGEMSLLVDGNDKDWETAFDLLLNKAFNELNLIEVHAEVYHCSPDFERWMKTAGVFRIQPITLPMRKFHDGRLWDAEYLSWRLPT